jgi:hypothetical protein
MNGNHLEISQLLPIVVSRGKSLDAQEAHKAALVKGGMYRKYLQHLHPTTGLL